METFSEWVENQLRVKNWRPADLARAAGVTNATLSRVLNGSRNPGPDLCRSLAKALNEPEEKVFRLAGLLSPLPSGDDPGISELTEIAKNLPADERQQLLDYAKFIYQKRSE